MNFRHLQFFVAVIECRGISKAAERLRVSQPAVSSALRTLEDNLGYTLFDRYSGGRRARPTARALNFYEHARDIIARCETARRSLASVQDKPPRTGIGVLQTLAAKEIARVNMSLNRGALQRRWSFREGGQSDLLHWLKTGRIDLAWTIIEEGAPNSDILWREPYVAMVSRQHPLAQSESLQITVQDLVGETIILRGSCELRNGALSSAGLKITPSARALRDELAMQFVARGGGFVIAPRSLATTDVVSLTVSDLGLMRAVGLRWRPDCPQAIIDEMKMTLTSAAP